MNETDGYSGIRAVATLCLVMACVFLGLSQRSDVRSTAVVSGPEELREHLWRAQDDLLPADDFPIYVEAGDFIYAGDGRDAEVLAEGLVPVARSDGGMRWPVTLYEDPLTFDTVFLNALGDEIFRLLPSEDYDPYRVFAAAFSEGSGGDAIDMSSYNPSRVILTAGLLDPFDLEPRAGMPDEAEPEAMDAGSTACPVAHVQDKSADVADSDSVRDADGAVGQERDGASGDDGSCVSPPLSATDAADVCGTIFVDSRNGNDLNTGRATAAETCEGGGQGEGPKKTIAAGLAAVKDGGRMAVAGGAYSEKLDVRGLNVRVYISGTLLLDKRVAAGSGGVAEGG